jgi:hypothetical protein
MWIIGSDIKIKPLVFDIFLNSVPVVRFSFIDIYKWRKTFMHILCGSRCDWRLTDPATLSPEILRLSLHYVNYLLPWLYKPVLSDRSLASVSSVRKLRI